MIHRRKGHDRGPHRAGHPDGRRRRSILFRRPSGAEDAPRTRRPSLHQLPARQVGGLYAWDFEENGRPFEVRVEGRLVFNNADLIREAALAGQGVAYVYEDEVMADIDGGRLKRTGGARPSPATISITPAGGRRHLLWLRSLARSATNAKLRKNEYICRAWTKEPNDSPSIHYSKCRDGIGAFVLAKRLTRSRTFRHVASTSRGSAARIRCLSLAKTCSIGFRSGL